MMHVIANVCCPELGVCVHFTELGESDYHSSYWDCRCLHDLISISETVYSKMHLPIPCRISNLMRLFEYSLLMQWLYVSPCHGCLGLARQPTSAMVMNITSSSATIEWEVSGAYRPSSPDKFAVLYGYYGYYSWQLNFGTAWLPSNPTDTTYSIQLTGLSAGTQYFYQIRSKAMLDVLVTDLMNFFTCM